MSLFHLYINSETITSINEIEEVIHVMTTATTGCI